MPKKNKSTQPVFVQKILQTINDHAMIRKGDFVLVGVSGGPDSMALFHGLSSLSGILDIRLGMAHMNHCLRGRESDEDAAFAAAEARRRGVPFYGESANIAQERKKTGTSPEEAARNARYRFFYHIQREYGFDKIALGHHLDDNAELILLNLLRGSGPGGISGIPPVRGPLIRPLMGVYRSEIIMFLKNEHIHYVLDASNDDPQFLRNKIRHHLIPLLKTNYNPNIIQGLNRTGNILRAEESWMAAAITPLYEKAVHHREEKQVVLSISILQSLHPAARGRVVRRAIEETKGNLRRISWTHIAAVSKCLQKPLPERDATPCLDLPDRIRVIRDADHLTITQNDQHSRQTNFSKTLKQSVIFDYMISEDDIASQTQVALPEINARMRFTKFSRNAAATDHFPGTAFFDWDRLNFPLTVRNVQAGDRFAPLGAGGSQKLKKFFIDHKIPVPERRRTPLLISRGTIIWVGGHRISERVKITPKTKTLLKVEILPLFPEAGKTTAFCR